MKLIVGLGNPGAKYQNTRHNLGFMVADSFAKSNGLLWRVSRDLLCYFAKHNEFVLIKPTTFMNKSGEAVRSVAAFYKIDSRDILVIHDDLDLPFGKIRVSFDSLSAGHNGIESVIESMSGPEFARLRIGIGSPRSPREAGKALGEAGHPREAEKLAHVDPSDYVLEKFSKDEEKKLKEVIFQSLGAVESYLSDGIHATMNRFN